MRRTDFTQLGMRYFTIILDTINQIGDICESCFGIISLGSLGALKQEKKNIQQQLRIQVSFHLY